MVKKTAKNAAPVRKKAVAKKAAPVRKKAVAKNAAPVRKKAVAKKAAPVRKKAIAKKAAPVRKKAIAKKAVAKKAVAKKAVAKKAAPVGRKAVAKKAAVSKKTSSTNAIVLTKNETDKVSTRAKTYWSDTETELPAFLQSPSVETKSETVRTQAYVKKKSKPFPLWLVVSCSTLAVILFAAFSTGAFDKSSLEKSDSVMVAKKPSQAETAKPIPSPSESADPKQSLSPKESTRSEKKSVSNSDTLAPRLFAGAAAGEEITFEWKSPISSGRVVGYELLTKPVGAQSWTSISSVTVVQLSITVELDSMVSTSDYRIASVLDNGKLIYNPLTLNFVGVVG